MPLKTEFTELEREQIDRLIQTGSRAAGLIANNMGTDMQLMAQAGIVAGTFIQLRALMVLPDKKAEKVSDA